MFIDIEPPLKYLLINQSKHENLSVLIFGHSVDVIGVESGITVQNSLHSLSHKNLWEKMKKKNFRK